MITKNLLKRSIRFNFRGIQHATEDFVTHLKESHYTSQGSRRANEICSLMAQKGNGLNDQKRVVRATYIVKCFHSKTLFSCNTTVLFFRDKSFNFIFALKFY